MSRVTASLTAIRTKSASGHNQVTNYDLDTAWEESMCPHCGGNQALRVATAGNVVWFRCVTCLAGSVRNNGTISPSSLPRRDVENLPPGDAMAWREARQCLGVGANTAAVTMCRKLLLHIAVAHGLPEEDDKGRAPGFAECVEHLIASGVVTAQMRAWVSRIKDVGNTANHRLVEVSAEDAEEVARFTEQLLVLAYELRIGPDAEA